MLPKLENSIPHQVFLKQQEVKQALKRDDYHTQERERSALETRRQDKIGK